MSSGSRGLLGRRRAPAVPVEVLERAGLARGERVLASGRASDGTWLLGGRRRLVVVLPDEQASGPDASGDGGVVDLPWEQVEDASWDRDESQLVLRAVGVFGRPRPTYTLELEDPERLLQLVRERVTASVVLQRRVPVRGRLGLTVIGRRNPTGGEITWMHAYDEGLDPDDPEVVVVADLALSQARAEVGGPI